MKRLLGIGTRRSPLALWQAEHVKALLEKHHADISCKLIKIVTQGDQILDLPLAQVGGKGLFVKEIEAALLKKEIDLAVHSMKDLPSELPPGLILGAVPWREDPRDALIAGQKDLTLKNLPAGATIGTSSLRRSSQLRFYRQDLKTAPVRGNVQTRIRKLDEGRFDAIILALAGLKRLDQTAAYLEELEVDTIFVGKAWSITTILKESHKALNEDQMEFYVIPENKDLIAQELLLFENSGSDDVEDFTDSQFSKANLIMKIRLQRS